MEEIWNELYKAAKSVQKEIKISDYVTAGEVGAAIESESGNIYIQVYVLIPQVHLEYVQKGMPSLT